VQSDLAFFFLAVVSGGATGEAGGPVHMGANGALVQGPAIFKGPKKFPTHCMEAKRKKKSQLDSVSLCDALCTVFRPVISIHAINFFF
jgi:hypothetical protein